MCYLLGLTEKFCRLLLSTRHACIVVNHFGEGRVPGTHPDQEQIKSRIRFRVSVPLFPFPFFFLKTERLPVFHSHGTCSLILVTTHNTKEHRLSPLYVLWSNKIVRNECHVHRRPYAVKRTRSKNGFARNVAQAASFVVTSLGPSPIYLSIVR